MELFGLHNKDGREYKLVENGVYWNASPVKSEKKRLPKTKEEFRIFLREYLDNSDSTDNFLKDYED